MARPRNASADAAILTEASRQLFEGGYDAVNIDEIAKAASLAKTTIYRRWPTKNHLVVAVLDAAHSELPVPNTGDLRADLTTILMGIREGIAPPAMRRIVAELAAASAADPELGAAIRALWATRRAQAAELLTAAIAAGEAHQGADPAIVLDQLAGPLYYRLLITGDEITAEYVDALVESVLRGIRFHVEAPE